MTPTPHLRFILRDAYRPSVQEVIDFAQENGVSNSTALKALKKPGQRILQQWWTTSEYIPIEGAPDGCLGEWKDVELVAP